MLHQTQLPCHADSEGRSYARAWHSFLAPNAHSGWITGVCFLNHTRWAFCLVCGTQRRQVYHALHEKTARSHAASNCRETCLRRLLSARGWVKALAFGRRLQQLLLPNLYEAVSVSKLRDKDMGDFRAATAKEPVLFENAQPHYIWIARLSPKRMPPRSPRKQSNKDRIGRRRIRCRQVCCMRILRWWCWRPRSAGAADVKIPFQLQYDAHGFIDGTTEIPGIYAAVVQAPATFPCDMRIARAVSAKCAITGHSFIGSAASDRRARSARLQLQWPCTECGCAQAFGGIRRASAFRNTGGDGAMTGQDDDSKPGAMRRIFCRVSSIHSRHLQVEHHRIILGCLDRLQRLRSLNAAEA